MNVDRSTLKIFQKTVSVLLVTSVLTSTLATSAPAKTKPSWSSLSQKLHKTNSSINSIQKRLRDTKKRQRTAIYEFAYAKKRLEFTRRSLDDIQYQLRQTRSKLSVAQAELNRVERRLEERNNLLSERLVDTYKYGNVSYLGVVLGANDYSDLVSRGYLIRKVLGTDVELIGSIKEDKEIVERHKAAIEAQARKRAELEQKQRAATNAAHSQTAECARMLRGIENDRAKQEQMFAALQADSNSIAAMMRRISGTTQGKVRDANAWHGKLMWPCSGRFTSRFGYRVHPIFHTRRFHSGTDIAAPSGTTIKAAAGGDVVFAGWKPAYGNTIVINHGGGLTTFYGHCSGFIARSGQTVKQGTPIARVGSTGLSTGPHVHFEVQRNGSPVAPF